MYGDNYDSSFDDDQFNRDEILEERYNKRRKMKEYLLKWKGYSSMNNVSKLKADLEYDALVSDYSFQNKKKNKKSKSKRSQSGASGSGFIGKSTYTVLRHGGPDGLVDEVKLTRFQTKEAKQHAFEKEGVENHGSDASDERSDEDSNDWPKMHPQPRESGIKKGWIPESVVPTPMVADLCERHSDDESGASNDDKPLV
ncbi:hypothetical protein LOAG_12932 [Loa loa]|uniref:Chromo domain-containing protein n=1 Tax=Loa loa TaxID=7209 RepID=A0A1I7VI20_LOALO|nr:hypothetical protein LOAG_12932 [Loa loa]EFO15576.2 hypothetical protein LOAG_12932 [Loa loa]